MPDTKITALTAIGANPIIPATFPIPMVDLTDTSMAASGTTKKVTVNQILGSGGTATLASATITGAATVGTTLGVTGVSTLTGAVGVGNTPIGKFDVYNTGSDTTVFIRSDTTRLGQIVFRDNADAGNQGIVRYDHANDRLSFTANGGENLYLLSTGDLSLITGNVVMATSGKGIDFSATAGTGTSELLNDYEEGTWTIGLTFGGGNTGLTTALNTGRYTKIGRQVTVCGRLELSNKGSSTGAAVITGLPFSIANANDAQQAASFRCNGLSYTGAFQGYGTAGSTTIPLEQISEAGSLTDLTDSNFVNGTSIQISLTYTV